MHNRLDQIDGLRGLAIVSVALFHAFARWSELMPYGAAFEPWFRDGRLGVELFFVISGFVILMTLERCTTFGQFMVKRWLRLFPAMAVCSVIVLATAPLMTARPNGQPALVDILPGLLFVQPRVFHLLGMHVDMLEGAFWSLFAEVEFYAIVATVYYTMGMLVTVLLLPALYGIAVLCNLLIPGKMEAVIGFLRLDLYGWFACGALFYQWLHTQDRMWLGGALAVGAAAAAGIATTGVDILAALVIPVLFWAALASQRFAALLSNKVLLLIGGISYPFYLLHESALVSMIRQLGAAFPALPPVLLPAIPLMVVGLVAWLVAHVAEPRLRALLQRPLRSLQLARA